MPRSAVDPISPETDPPGADADLTDVIIDLGLRAGLATVGTATAAVFADTRQQLVERKRRGLHAAMQFTYRNPERSTDPGRILAGARSLVVGAWSYRQREVALDPDAPRPDARVARYARHDHYSALRRALSAVGDHLEAQGHRAVVVCDDNALVDRAAAHRAGLGWFGKNSLLILPGLGSWFVLGTVVTDARLRMTAASGPIPHAGGCGICTKCQTACPTDALVEPGVVDARRCLAWLVQAPGDVPLEYRQALGDRIYGCDECQQVCPINRLADRRHPPPAGPAGQQWVDLVDLLQANDQQLLDRHGRWYIPDRQPRYLRRNALVALGNVGDGHQAPVVGILRRYLDADDPMLVEHAQWAARQLGRADLVGAP